jgi:hypothetical protein
MSERHVGGHTGVLRVRVRLLSLLCCLLVAGALVDVAAAGATTTTPSIGRYLELLWCGRGG